jgi:hypothetical protein
VFPPKSPYGCLYMPIQMAPVLYLLHKGAA